MTKAELYMVSVTIRSTKQEFLIDRVTKKAEL